MQFRYWPWLIHVDLAWRLSRENTRVPHDRDYASLEFIVNQLLASRDVRLEILRRISELDSTPIKIKLALTTRNVLQISLLPSCLHARPATALSIYWYVRTHTHTHTYTCTHTRVALTFVVAYSYVLRCELPPTKVHIMHFKRSVQHLVASHNLDQCFQRNLPSLSSFLPSCSSFVSSANLLANRLHPK